MPSLSLFNRAWRFGSDDFVFPGIVGVLIRGSWLIIISIIFGISYHDISQCHEAKVVKIFFLTILPLLLFEFVTETCITFISMKGNIMDTSMRSSIVKYIYIRFFLFFPELILMVMGSVWIFNPGVNCDTDIIWSIRILVGCQWAVLIIVLIIVAIFFNPLGKLDSEGRRLFSVTTTFEKALESYFQKTCFCPGNQHEAFSLIAKQINKLFHDVDLVPSDIAAGLILLYREQGRKAREEQHVINSRQWINERLVEQQDAQMWERFDESVYFYHYAMGSYGWPLYVYMNLCCGCCKLCKICKCGCAHLFSGILIEGDSCCHANTSGFISQSPKHEDIEHVFVSFTNEVYQTPFCVSIDHNHKKVVVCVRGTLSLKDVITDLTAETEHLDIEHNHDSEEKYEGHKGMTKSARFILEKLESGNILEPIMLRYPDYGLVIVGHSLGAGTAAILGVLMKPKYKTVKCYAISPPQALNLKAAEYCEDFVTSVIVGNDIVARLSIHSIDILKKDLINVINQCKFPKYQILLGGCWQMLCSCLCSCFGPPSDESRLLLPENYVSGAHTSIPTGTAETSDYEELFCPGKILHLTERKSNFDVIHGDRQVFERIAIAPNMLANHLPDNVMRAFDSVYSNVV